MRRRQSSAISPIGRDMHRRWGESSTSSGPEAVMHGQGDVTGEQGEGSRVPDAEGAPVVNEIFREPSVFDKDDTGLGFTERGLTATDRNRLSRLPSYKMASH
ncbi:hypothetical protein U1Q18_006850, partial [Sarracenia purpurea var. burkii]